MEEKKGITHIALAGSVGTDKERKWTQLESRILEILESFQADELDHGAPPSRKSRPFSLVPRFILTVVLEGRKGDRSRRCLAPPGGDC